MRIYFDQGFEWLETDGKIVTKVSDSGRAGHFVGAVLMEPVAEKQQLLLVMPSGRHSAVDAPVGRIEQ